MVTEVEPKKWGGSKVIYACSVCGFGYADKKTAQACEDFCKTHQSCSMEITKNAVWRPV